MPVITLPTNMEFDRWADQLRIDLPLMSIPIHDGVDNWQDWAIQVIYNNDNIVIPLPTDISYPNKEDWRKWGIRLYQVMQAIPNK